jgi:hypothetical protein
MQCHHLITKIPKVKVYNLTICKCEKRHHLQKFMIYTKLDPKQMHKPPLQHSTRHTNQGKYRLKTVGPAKRLPDGSCNFHKIPTSEGSSKPYGVPSTKLPLNDTSILLSRPKATLATIAVRSASSSGESWLSFSPNHAIKKITFRSTPHKCYV